MRCISSRPARIGSLAPPNCWSNTRTKIPAAPNFDTFPKKLGDRIEQVWHATIAYLDTRRQPVHCLGKTLMDF